MKKLIFFFFILPIILFGENIFIPSAFTLEKKLHGVWEAKYIISTIPASGYPDALTLCGGNNNGDWDHISFYDNGLIQITQKNGKDSIIGFWEVSKVSKTPFPYIKIRLKSGGEKIVGFRFIDENTVYIIDNGDIFSEFYVLTRIPDLNATE